MSKDNLVKSNLPSKPLKQNKPIRKNKNDQRSKIKSLKHNDSILGLEGYLLTFFTEHHMPIAKGA